MVENIPLSIIVPWFGGNQQREQSLQNMVSCICKQGMPANREPIIYELLIVEQDNGSQLPTLNTTYKHIKLKTDNKEFNKSWCMNVGAQESSHNHLLFIDADSLFGEDYFRILKHSIRTLIPPNQDLFICWSYLLALSGKDNPNIRYIRPDMTRAMGGIWYSHKYTYFHLIGGMNENYFGYGGEDNDTYERTCCYLKANTVMTIPYPIIHQYHDWAPQSKRAINYFEATRKHPQEVIHRLQKANIGNKQAPTLIKMDDLL